MERPVNVYHVIPKPEGGGAERLVRELVKRLPDHGIHARGIYFYNPKRVPLAENEQCFDLPKRESSLAIPALVRLFRSFDESGHHIVHTHLTHPLYYSLVGGVGRHAHLFFTEHNTFNRRRSSRIFRPIERAAYRLCKRVVCISDATDEALREWLRDPSVEPAIRVINNGSRLFSNAGFRSVPPEGLDLVSIGALRPQKGFEYGIDAVARVRDLVRRYRIVGEGPELEKLKRLRDSHGLQDKVEFLGWSDRIKELLQQAHVQLIPSRWEGFGLVAVEGMSTGIRVIASSVPGLKEIVGESSGGMLVEPHDPDAIASAIETINHELVQGLDRSGEAAGRAGLFSIEQMVDNYASLYRDFVAN